MPLPKQKMNLKFNYSVPIIESSYVNDEFIIQGTAINATLTSNNHKFLAEELEKSAHTLSGVPLLIDHRNEISAIKGRVIAGDFDETEKRVNFRANVIDSQIKEMIKDGRINSVSVGCDVDKIEEFEGYFIPHGITFKELSLVAVGADEGATFTTALHEAYNLNKPNNKKQITKKVLKKEPNTQLNNTGGKIMKSENAKTDIQDKGVTEERLQTMIDSAVLKAVEKSKIVESDTDEDAKKPVKEPEAEPAKEPEKEDAEPVKEPEADEDADEDVEEPVVEEKDKYKIIQGHGSLRGGSFTLVRA